ncbi:hypothetical protein TNIN_77111 [Trichonephila inaurata madagascariensis]|uniref:Uncharacterized protein n=1 Tax=Trichonephila inaurata madagascariensis TaxID=2747483 RepID=A0A8X6M826_9ARAC|nr:hypothetical protein TNIN_77111 [Trichonephila inaurata madagascariensis]
MNSEYDILPLLTLQDIMKSDKELEYIKEMRNFSLKIITEKSCTNEYFLHKFVLRKRDLKLFRFCLSHAISDHVDMLEENCSEDLENIDETIEKKRKPMRIRTRSLTLHEDNDGIIQSEMLFRSAPNEKTDTSRTENAIDVPVDSTAYEREYQNISKESCLQQEFLSTAEITEFYNSIEVDEIYSDRIHNGRTPKENNRTSDQPGRFNTVNSAHQFTRSVQVFPGIGQVLIHFFDNLWYPFAWYDWQINAKLPQDYVNVEVETGSIDSTFQSIWRRLYSGNYSYFSCDFRNCKILKLKENHSKRNRVNILYEIMKRERDGYLNEFKVLDAISWPYYYVLPRQNEDECLQFQFDSDWYEERNPLDYAIVAFATFLITERMY